MLSHAVNVIPHKHVANSNISKYLQTNILQLNICRRVCLLKVFLECQFAVCKQKFHYNWNIWPFYPVNMNQISPKSRGSFYALSIWTLIEFVEIHLGLTGIEIYQSCSKMHISPEQYKFFPHSQFWSSRQILYCLTVFMYRNKRVETVLLHQHPYWEA